MSARPETMERSCGGAKYKNLEELVAIAFGPDVTKWGQACADFVALLEEENEEEPLDISYLLCSLLVKWKAAYLTTVIMKRAAVKYWKEHKAVQTLGSSAVSRQVHKMVKEAKVPIFVKSLILNRLQFDGEGKRRRGPAKKRRVVSCVLTGS